MANTYKVLGQAAPAATTNTDLYTVPSATQAVCSTLSACNRGLTTSIRVAVRPAGAALTNAHYIVYEYALDQYDSIFLTLGVSLSAGDIVTVYSTSADVSFGLFGTEVA